MTPIHPQVLEILACPVPTCRARLEWRAPHLVCTGCGRKYRLEDGWPVLIPEEADPPEGVGK